MQKQWPHMELLCLRPEWSPCSLSPPWQYSAKRRMQSSASGLEGTRCWRPVTQPLNQNWTEGCLAGSAPLLGMHQRILAASGRRHPLSHCSWQKACDRLIEQALLTLSCSNYCLSSMSCLKLMSGTSARRGVAVLKSQSLGTLSSLGSLQRLSWSSSASHSSRNSM